VGSPTGAGGGGFGGGFAGGGGQGGELVGGGRRGGPQRPEKVSEAVEQLYQQFNEKSLDEIPARDLKFPHAADKVPTKLFRADPKLLENKFVAQFTLLPAGLDPTNEKSVEEFRQRQAPDSRESSSLPKNLLNSINWGGVMMFRSERGFNFDEALSLSQQFKLLAENCAPGQRPDIAFLTSSEADRDVLRNSQGSSRRGGGRAVGEPLVNANWSFTVYAPTPEEAQTRATAIVRLLDGGLSRPMQKYFLTQGRAALENARQAQAEVISQVEAMHVETQKLTKPSEISPDILSQLKAQKVMVAVELAGLIARVKACDEMLKDPKKLEISTLQSVSDMKVKAEIERVGIKEKLDQINVFIGEGDGREAASSRLAAAEAAKLRAQQRLSNYDRMANSYAQLVLLYAPLQIEGNEIKISPIEWTN